MSNASTFSACTINDVMKLTDTLMPSIQESVNKAKPHEGYRKKLYFAAPWFDPIMTQLYFELQYIASRVGNKSTYEIYWPKNYQQSNPEDTYWNNMTNINECDTLIAFIGRKDVGTAFELGMANGLRKFTYLLGYDETCFASKTNIMLAYSGNALTVRRFHSFLLGNLELNELVKISPTWEGKE